MRSQVVQTNLDLYRVSYYSLAILALCSIAGSFDLTFWEIVELLVITAGIAWLLLRRAPLLSQVSRSEPPYGVLLIALVYMFVLSQFTWMGNGGTGLLLFASMLVGLAFVGVCFSRHPLFMLSMLDKFMLAGGGIAVLVSLSVQFILGPEGGQGGFLRWMGTLYIFELMLVYFVVSRLLTTPKTKQYSTDLLTIVTVTFGLMSLIGGWRIASAFYYSSQSVKSFRAGQYDEVRRYTSRLSPKDKGLKLGFVSLEHALNAMVNTAATSGSVADAYVVVGDIADRSHLWETASRAYRIAFERDPNFPAIHAKLGNSLFEQGLQLQALEIYRKGVAQSNAQMEDHLSLGIALARMGAWDDANRALDQAVELSGLQGRIAALFSSGQEVVSERLDSLLPHAFSPYVEKITLFEAVELLQHRGWKIFHPTMRIGSTGVAAPVDIVALSGGGRSTPQESLRVKGEEVSAHKRGYNVAVIDPQTGKVESTDSFDTWENVSEGNRLADYLKGIHRGKIVAATINDEGSGALVGYAKAELQKVGVSRFPGPWWSHAFIGIKGSARGSASEALGSQIVAVVGALGANMPEDAAKDPTRFEALLQKAAAEAPGKVAVFIPQLDATATITVAHR